MMILGIEDFSTNLTECADHVSGVKTYKEYNKYAYGDLKHEWVDKCPVPCIQTSYIYELKKLHANSWLNAG